MLQVKDEWKWKKKMFRFGKNYFKTEEWNFKHDRIDDKFRSKAKRRGIIVITINSPTVFAWDKLIGGRGSSCRWEMVALQVKDEWKWKKKMFRFGKNYFKTEEWNFKHDRIDDKFRSKAKRRGIIVITINSPTVFAWDKLIGGRGSSCRWEMVAFAAEIEGWMKTEIKTILIYT